MLIRELRKHWPARKTEWIMAGFLLAWGVYTLMHPEVFTNDGTRLPTAYMVSMVAPISSYPALVWGGGAALIAAARLIALLINGSWTRTPLIRTVMAMLSIFVITQIWIGLFKSGVPNWGVVVYPFLAGTDTLSAFRAAVDVVHAEAERGAMKETTNHARVGRLAS